MCYYAHLSHFHSGYVGFSFKADFFWNTPLWKLKMINQIRSDGFVSLLLTDDICDYFGVKIAMYFAWLGFYTNSMLYPAVIGFLLWIFAESDQASFFLDITGVYLENGNINSTTQYMMFSWLWDMFFFIIKPFWNTDKPGYLLCGVCPFQCGVGYIVPGEMEASGSRTGI